MAITEEKFKVNISFSCDVTYKGKVANKSELSDIKESIEDDIRQAVYDNFEHEELSIGYEDLDTSNEECDIEIIYKND